LPEPERRADKLDLRLATRESGTPSRQPAVRDSFISVVVADDHPLLRAGIRRVLDAEAGFAVVGEAGNGAGAVELVERLKPDVLLLDLDMPGSSGLDALRSLGDMVRRVRVILLTSELDRQGIIKGLQLGARGVVFKDADPDLLVKAIQRVLTGQYWVGREMVGDLVGLLCELLDPGSVNPRPLAFGLTTRELDVVEKVVSGATNKQIAKALRMSEETVKHHLTSVFAKVGVSTRLELALFAVHHRLVTPQTFGDNPPAESQRPPAAS
jgi:two-component system nitrate/nitrite response regulator NarL